MSVVSDCDGLAPFIRAYREAVRMHSDLSQEYERRQIAEDEAGRACTAAGQRLESARKAVIDARLEVEKAMLR